MSVAFYKMNGLGNDFVVVDARARKLKLGADAARRIGDRHRGVGFDQLLVIEPSKGAGDFALRIWNPDGSETGACGNGTRCVADLLLTETKKPSVTLQTLGGLLTCTRDADGRVTVDMGEPKLEWQDIPLAERMDTRTIDVRVGPLDAPVLIGPSAVNMGNPHCIFFVENAQAHDLSKIGPMLEYHPMFPERANISLAQVMSKNEIRLRVWERGAGQTQACGSAACAATVAAARRKLTDRKVRIVLDGGPLDIEWREDNHVLMTGPTELNFTGELDERYFLDDAS
ncbi:MAG: diaminopimelate epimerase [Alphaproteobacteria bacterium]|jgi:diaminopimelate epimerase|nr:diaminopimelate epimerase [Alphaproteobacteria bacterium]